MSLVSLAIEKKTVTYFATFLIVAAGILSYFQLGQLEDPEFTVKTASITTSYPGASPEEVELEVTDLIETKLQEMEEIKNIYSYRELASLSSRWISKTRTGQTDCPRSGMYCARK